MKTKWSDEAKLRASLLALSLQRSCDYLFNEYPVEDRQMGHYVEFHAIVKPKEEHRAKWEAGGATIDEDISWLVDKRYPGVRGMFKLDDTPYLNVSGYLEFRCNDKHANLYRLLDVLDQLEEYAFLVHHESEYIEVIVSETLSVPFENGVFKLTGDEVTVVNPVYKIDSDGDESTMDTEATGVKLEMFKLGGMTFRTNLTIVDMRWNACTFKHYDEIVELYDKAGYP